MAANFIAWVPDLVVAGGRINTRTNRGFTRGAVKLVRIVTPKSKREWLDQKAARVDHMQTKMVNGFDKVAEVTGFGTATSVATLGLSHLGKVGKLGRLSNAAVKAGKMRQTKNRLRTVKAVNQALAISPQPVKGVAEATPSIPRAQDGQRPARVKPMVIEGEVLPAAELGRDSQAVGGGFRPATPARAISQGAAERGQTSDPHVDQRFLAQIQADFPDHASLEVEDLNHTPAPTQLPQPVARRNLPPRVAGQGARPRPSRHLTGVR